MERENQRISITKRLLKDSLMKILQEKELDAVTVSELCRRAGINRATFYRHYDIPKDVLVEIQNDLYCQLRQQVELPKTTKDIHGVIEKLCYFLDDHRDWLRIFVQNCSDMDFSNFMQDIFLELASEYGQKDALKKLSAEDIRLLSLYITGGSYFVLRSWVLGSIQKTPSQMADYVFSLLNKTEELLRSSLMEQTKR